MAEKDLVEGTTAKFSFARDGQKLAGFVARFRGQCVAYQNLCRHIAISIDYDDNAFFNSERTHFVCQTHGAVYDPLTGKCVRGPCPGEFLFPVLIEVLEGSIWLVEPEK